MNTNTPLRRKRKAPSRVSVADRQRNLELLTVPVIRAIVRRARVSPLTAAAIAEISGFEVPYV